MTPRPSEPDPVLGPVVREERERQGRSRESLAHDAGLTTNSVARIELGQSDPSLSTVRRLADALGLSMQELGKRLDKN